MGFWCGLVGLPNVGKSTLFNALTRSAQATVADYPFSTIAPTTAEVPVPDRRLEQVAEAAGSASVTPTRLGFVDIAGLVKGASTGEGLGNRFLAHIREVDAVLHVLRCFEDREGGGPDPESDWEIVQTELLVSDLERTERLLASLARRVRGGDKEAALDSELLALAQTLLREGKPARIAAARKGERRDWRRLGLLTAKPVLIAANADGLDPDASGIAVRRVEALAAREGVPWIEIASAVEAEVAAMDPEEAAAFLSELGISEPGLGRLVHAGYALLDLVTFFTAGAKEARALTLRRGSTALEAAGKVHSDFARGFIRAETVDWQTFASLGGEVAVRDAGLMRSEGRGYAVADGDVIRFRFNV